MEKMFQKKEEKNKPRYKSTRTSLIEDLLVLVAIVYLAELSIMISLPVLSRMFSLSSFQQAMFDTIVLSIILSPVLYRYIAHRNRAEEALRKNEQFIQAIFSGAGDAIRVIDTDFNVIRSNPAMAKLSGVPEDKAEGMKCYVQLPGEFCHTDNCTLRRILRGEKSVEYEIIKETPDGRKIYTRLIATPLTDEDGNVQGIIELFQDITERKRAEEELRKANIELKKADQLKTQFLSITSHELRTPLTPMIAHLQMLLEGYFGEITEEQKKSLDTILRNAIRLNRLISDILDISRLGSGTMKFIMAKNNLNEVVKNAVETMKSRAWDKNIELTLKEDRIPEIVFDRDRITQVIVNLISNAIKFTDEGGKIEVELLDGKNQAIIKVKDNGIGIKKEDQERIFRPFEQVDSSMTRNYEGSGLGLAICKGIVTYHGGMMWVESEPGKGSTFIFTIPYKYDTKETKVEIDLFGVKKEWRKNGENNDSGR